MIALLIHDYTVEARVALREILSEGRKGITLAECAGRQCVKCKYRELCRDLSANIRYLDEYDSPI